MRFKLISVLIAIVIAMAAALTTSTGNLQPVLEIEDGFAGEGETTTVNIIARNVTNLANFDITVCFDPNVVKVLDADNNPVFGTEVNNLNYSDNCIRIASLNLGGGQSGDVVISTLTLKAVGSKCDESNLEMTVNTLVDPSEKDIPVTTQNGVFKIIPCVQPILKIENASTCDETTTNVTAYNVEGLANFDITVCFDPNVVKVLDADNNPVFGTEVNNLNYSDNCIRIASLNLGGGQSGDVWLSKLKLKAVGGPGDCSELMLIPNTLVNSSEEDITVKVENGIFCIPQVCGPLIQPEIIEPEDGSTLSGTVEIVEVNTGTVPAVYNLFQYYPDTNGNCVEDDDKEWMDIGNDTDGSDGWSVEWNTKKVSDGNYLIRATMGDASGNTGSDQICVLVSNPPEPRITNPPDGSCVSGVVTIEEVDESGQNDIVYNKFEYSSDGVAWTEIGTDYDGSDGWSIEWNTNTLTPGDYQIRATMGDFIGNVGQDVISVTVGICNEVYFKPEVSKARFCKTTDVEIWINGSNFQGGQINLTYDSNCAEVVNWVRDKTTFPYGGWNSLNEGSEWITFANESILSGEYRVGTLTIHCVDDDSKCSTGLHFDKSHAINYSALFDDLGKEIPVKWKDGVFECWCGICGDVNCDEKVNMGDVILLLNNVTYGYPLCNIWAGDVNCDGKLNMGDVILLLNHVTYGYSLNCCPECC